MDAQDINVPEIMNALGGTGSAARFFDVNPAAISQWKKANHIPRARLMWLKVVRPDLFRRKKKAA